MKQGDQEKIYNIIFYTILFSALLISIGSMYLNLVVNQNFYQFTVDDERPNPFNPFIYNKEADSI